jgi:hypothetical protein
LSSRRIIFTFDNNWYFFTARPYMTRRQDKTTKDKTTRQDNNQPTLLNKTTSTDRVQHWAVWITEPLNYQIAGPRPFLPKTSTISGHGSGHRSKGSHHPMLACHHQQALVE